MEIMYGCTACGSGFVGRIASEHNHNRVAFRLFGETDEFTKKPKNVVIPNRMLLLRVHSQTARDVFQNITLAGSSRDKNCVAHAYSRSFKIIVLNRQNCVGLVKKFARRPGQRIILWSSR